MNTLAPSSNAVASSLSLHGTNSLLVAVYAGILLTFGCMKGLGGESHSVAVLCTGFESHLAPKG